MPRQNTHIAGDRTATCDWNFIEAVCWIVFLSSTLISDVRSATRD
jgi:hypothetical protein